MENSRGCSSAWSLAVRADRFHRAAVSWHQRVLRKRRPFPFFLAECLPAKFIVGKSGRSSEGIEITSKVYFCYVLGC